MSNPDPDKDLLDRLDRRERKAEILAAVFAVLAGLAAGGVAYAIARWELGLGSGAAIDIAAILFIGCGLLLFRGLSKNS